MSFRTPAGQSTLAGPLFVTMLILLGVIVSWLVVSRIDPRPAHLGSGTHSGSRARAAAQTGRQ